MSAHSPTSVERMGRQRMAMTPELPHPRFKERWSFRALAYITFAHTMPFRSPGSFDSIKGGEMANWKTLLLLLVSLALACVPGWGQGAAPPSLPIPVPGGDVLPNPDGSTALWNVFGP